MILLDKVVERWVFNKELIWINEAMHKDKVQEIIKERQKVTIKDERKGRDKEAFARPLPSVPILQAETKKEMEDRVTRES